MSITAKELGRIRSLLKKGDFTKISDKINVSQPWVSRVLNSIDLANKHSNVITAALDIIEEKNIDALKVKQRIQEVTK